ncbi:sigma-54-dependent Fis family transcriptional regulator [Bacillus sp. DNRA2]|uniref:sigma-54-dependent Fis family transcriptional regulator n=1 Tax=Bacillus sp. DNRA2 TaxID=2723053 RepID=UPI00145CEA3D|nr:sigma-54-dependent Fis family transcriptional regulator [Bacillus sp. DNRA2]NMD69863.1 sigma-54-dependent Fis family transcriptional regulator [Bacillus sp. DNRA2]
MNNPYISIFSTRDLPEKTKELTQLWEKFISKSWSTFEIEKIRNNVFDSWKRCQEIGVDPRQQQASTALSDDELKQFWQNAELFQIAKPIIDDYFKKMTGTGYLITLADNDGHIVYVKGETSLMRAAEKMNFAQGVDWSEAGAGTNAIGTSITTKSPIQILSAEHFCEGCHPWTCSSAPIIHPFTNEVLGAIDFTGFWGNAQPHTLGLAVSLAQVIEQQLSKQYFKIYQKLTESYFHGISKWKSEYVLIINDSLMVAKSSMKLQEKLNLPQGSNLQDSPNIYHTIYHHMMKIEHTNPIMPENVFIDDFQLIKIKPIYYQERLAGYRIVFKEKPQSIIKQIHKIPDNSPWDEVIGTSKLFLAAIHKCQKAAVSAVPILLLGESGTGKERIAQCIHQSSQRTNQPFIAINCGAIQKELIASELFGYEKGSFTGALKEGKQGKFEEANGGTLFLDEIGEMPLDLQVHLLRVLQEKEITRVGSSKRIPVNVRIVAATNKNLFELSKNGLFREDLLFRLNVVSVNIPPLRERENDLTLVTEYFLKIFSVRYNKEIAELDKEVVDFLSHYHWPGNIRELQNVLEHAVLFCENGVIEMTDLPSYLLEGQKISSNAPELSMLDHEERKVLVKLLEETSWNLSAVAKRLNIARSTLYRKLRKYQIKDSIRGLV